MHVLLAQLISGVLVLASQMPNIVFAMLDDVGMHDVGYNGSPIPTPYIDQLSAKGIRLTNYYVHPLCTPSRAALMSGRYGPMLGLAGILPGWSQIGLDVGWTLPGELKKLGYGTYMSGKWHLGYGRKKYLPTTNGFDEFIGMLGPASGHFSNSYSYGHMTAFDWARSTAEPYTLEHFLDPRYSTTKITENAIEFMRRHSHSGRNDSAFLYVAFQACHTPVQALPEDVEKCNQFRQRNRRGFCAQMQGIDRAIRDLVMASIEYLGSNTIIILSSDNGGIHLNGGVNWPYRAAKSSPFEGGSKVPAFIADLSGNSYFGESGVEFTGLMHISDFLETLVRLAAESYEGDSVLLAFDSNSYITDGVNQLEAIRRRKASDRDSVLIQYDPGINMTSYIYRKWKFIEGSTFYEEWYPEPTGIFFMPEKFSTAIVIGELVHMLWDTFLSRDRTWIWAAFVSRLLGIFYRFVNKINIMSLDTDQIAAVTINHGGTFLFDLEKDPYERNNVASTHQEIVHDIRDRIHTATSSIDFSVRWWTCCINPAIMHHEPDMVCDVKTEQDESIIETSTTLGTLPCVFSSPFMADDEPFNKSDPKWIRFGRGVLMQLRYQFIAFFLMMVGGFLAIVFVVTEVVSSICCKRAALRRNNGSLEPRSLA